MKAALRAAIAEQLQLVWNARGAADLAKIETALTALMGATSGGPVMKNLDAPVGPLTTARTAVEASGIAPEESRTMHTSTRLLAAVAVAAVLSPSSTASAQTVGPDTTIAMSHSGNFTVGVNGAYTIVVSNIGGTATSGHWLVVVGLGEPLGFTYVSATGAGWSCGHRTPEFGGDVLCEGDAVVGPGGSAPPITLTVRPNASGTVTNTASAFNESDTVFTNNTASDVTIVLPAVPTLPQWALIALTGCLALAGVAALRRRTTLDLPGHPARDHPEGPHPAPRPFSVDDVGG